MPAGYGLGPGEGRAWGADVAESLVGIRRNQQPLATKLAGAREDGLLRGPVWKLERPRFLEGPAVMGIDDGSMMRELHRRTPATRNL